jgi:hypothetical protein
LHFVHFFYFKRVYGVINYSKISLVLLF